MFPIIFHSGNFVLASWHVFFVLGAFAAWYGMQRLRTALVPDWTEGQMDKFFVGLYIVGYFGARIFSIFFEDGVSDVFDFFRQLFTFGSMTLYGGIIAVSLCVVFYSFRKKTGLDRVVALLCGPGLVAIGLGRIGCHLNGDDYGAAVPDQMHPPTWAVKFPNLEDSIYRYPVQLCESAFALVLGLILIAAAKRWPQQSLRIADAGVLGYTVARFLLEDLRGDERGRFLGTALSTSQGVSIALLLTWIGIRVWGQTQGKRAGSV